MKKSRKTKVTDQIAEPKISEPPSQPTGPRLKLRPLSGLGSVSAGMACPKCKKCPKTMVMSTFNRPGYIMRYRECPLCGYRFRTDERTGARAG